MHIHEFLSGVSYNISTGDKFCWKCFGDNAHTYVLGNPNDDNSPYVDVIFDLVTKQIYRMEAWDRESNVLYHWTDPQHLDALEQEADQLHANINVSVDGEKFVQLEEFGDFIEKAHAIYHNLPYDDRVEIVFDLPHDVQLTLMQEAHRQDITFNQFIINILMDKINQELPND